jgi:signal peptidase I
MADRDDHPRGAAPDDPERLFTSSSPPSPASGAPGTWDAASRSQAAGSADDAGGQEASGSTDATDGHPDGASAGQAGASGRSVERSGEGVSGSGGDGAGSGGDGAGPGGDGAGSGRGVSGSGRGVSGSGGDGAGSGRDGGGSGRAAAKGGSFLRELPVLLLIAFVLAFLLRTFVLQVFYIPSSSMEPTLQIDDRMVVEKLTYLAREPRRGEIVVFEGETLVDPYADQGTVARVVRGVGQFLGVVPASARDFVKRVIGVEGDEVVIESGQVFVNGEPIDEPYVVFDDGSDYGPVTVPEGHLFFLGDNRPNSSDSRRSLGFVPRGHVVGRAAVVIWPPDHAGRLTGVEHQVPESPGADGGEGPVTDDEAGEGDGQAAGREPSPRVAAEPTPVTSEVALARVGS